jgi:hypothetical protein
MAALGGAITDHHNGSSKEIRYDARGLLGIHTFFMVDVFSTKAEIPLGSWLLASSWLVISSTISSCFFLQNELPPAEVSAI